MLRVMPIVICAALLLAACAGPHFETAGVNRQLTPERAAARFATFRGSAVLWGGRIIATHNLRDTTEIQVLAYPLDYYQQPNETGKPQGRFLVVKSGYLDPVDYAPGREVTVTGVVSQLRQGHVGAASYLYPTITRGLIYLWPREDVAYPRNDSGFHIGVGVMLSR